MGCGDGDYSKALLDLGFDVTAADLDVARFRYKDSMRFQKCDVTKPLPFPDQTFDYFLNIQSRVRYLAEGAYEFFRETPLDQVKNPKENIFNLHIVPYRYQELEYLLSASVYENRGLFFSRLWRDFA